MSKRTASTWGWATLSFLVAGILAVLAGPSMGSISRWRQLQGSTDFCN